MHLNGTGRLQKVDVSRTPEPYWMMANVHSETRCIFNRARQWPTLHIGRILDVIRSQDGDNGAINLKKGFDNCVSILRTDIPYSKQGICQDRSCNVMMRRLRTASFTTLSYLLPNPNTILLGSRCGNTAPEARDLPGS